MQQSKRSFFISYLEGKKFSKISGDNNKIHLNKKIGYNSIFGENICHGALLIIKTVQSYFNYKRILSLFKKFEITEIYKNNKIIKKTIIDSRYCLVIKKIS